MQKKNKNLNNNSFLDVIKEKMEDYTLPVDDTLWSEIEAQLPVAKKVRLFPWIISTAVAASIAVLLLIFPFNKNTGYHESEKLSQNEPPITEDVLEEKNVIGFDTPLSENQFVAVVQEQENRKPVRSSVGSGDEVSIATGQSENLAVAIPATEEPVVNQPGKEPAATKRLSQEEAERLLYAMTKEGQDMPLPVKKAKGKNSLGLSVASGKNYVAANNNPILSGGNWGLRAEGSPIPHNVSKELADELFTYKDFENVSHSAPLSFGLSIRKGLNSRFSLETGLTYTYLASKFKNESPRREANLYLHYLGVPLNVVATLYDNPKWNIYLSAGGMIEKGIYSQYSQDHLQSDNNIRKAKTNSKIEGVQFSLNFAPGLEYRFDKNYSVYLEPKLGYYFENNQPVSVRTEHPLSIGITAGLRFTL